MAWIYHPKLDRTVEVPDSSVVVWVHSGWQPTDPPPPPPVPEPEPEQVDQAPRRRKSRPAAAGADTEE
jgi:hypothetical protein